MNAPCAGPIEIDATRIDWSSLEAAFCYRAPDCRAYLDIATGQVPIIRDATGEGAVMLARIASEPGRYLLVEPMPARDQHGWISSFIASLEDEVLRAELSRAVAGPGAFRLFKQVLRAHHREVQRWFRFRSALLRPRIVAWLRSHGLVSATPAAAPPRPAPPPTPENQPVDEALMRQIAHAHLDSLPDTALDLAISYLRYRLRPPT